MAVKQVISKDGEEEFHKEVRIMQALSGCDRVVRLLGICTEGDPKLMVMELMCKVCGQLPRAVALTFCRSRMSLIFLRET